jgi:hypothetical protein
MWTLRLLHKNTKRLTNFHPLRTVIFAMECLRNVCVAPSKGSVTSGVPETEERRHVGLKTGDLPWWREQNWTVFSRASHSVEYRLMTPCRSVRFRLLWGTYCLHRQVLNTIKKHGVVCGSLCLVYLWPWRWRRYVTQNCRILSQVPSVSMQKFLVFIFAVARNSNPLNQTCSSS